MTPGSPAAEHIWWLAGRGAGLVALVLLTASVTLGLLSASGLWVTPGIKKVMVKTHEYLSLNALVVILTHGLLFIPDRWLKPGLAGVLIPWQLHYRPGWVAAGIFGGYLAAVLSLSFYARRRVGAKRWRSAHRLVIIAWALSVVHSVGAGTDGRSLWLVAVLAGCMLPVTFLFIARMLPAQRRQARERARHPEREAWGTSSPSLVASR